MLTFLPPPLLGALMLVLLALNTVFWAIPVYAAILLKVVTPRGPLRDAVSRLTAWLAQLWSTVNVKAVDWFLRVEWEVRIPVPLRRDGQYLVCANHQSWNDIFVLMRAFGRRAPFFKFFIKQELIWVPVLGLAWWGLDYPFMKRYSPEQIARNPALKGKDLETTRKACQNFRNQPAIILNFLEGTRFTREKHARQESPYRHLLRAKAGGFAFTLTALGDTLDGLLDVTIVYPEGARGFFDFLAGRVRKVVVDVRPLAVPKEFYRGDYEGDAEFRRRFQTWVAELWAQKDQRFEQLLQEARAA